MDTHIKTGNSQPFKVQCQIKSRLIQIMRYSCQVFLSRLDT
ncbi:hypothetical protein UUU_02840 [Klebsiella pneumoniae subsp. pneumoniae DSM 30104 = JCM 1662 = NBRC 14940]|nr:hypothetical protein UUU_02840 [Klebsiella pneumoniae subsp. pneumoniae DSM 30104 = JCM 1662 = NBRC 14940]